MKRTHRTSYCSLNKVGVLKEFVCPNPRCGTGQGDEDESRDQCEAYCLLQAGCQACSIDYDNGGRWNAIPECGRVMSSASADIEGAISIKQRLGRAL